MEYTAIDKQAMTTRTMKFEIGDYVKIVPALDDDTREMMPLEFGVVADFFTLSQDDPPGFQLMFTIIVDKAYRSGVEDCGVRWVKAKEVRHATKGRVQ